MPLRSAMAANIEKSGHVVAVAGEDNAFSSNVAEKVVAMARKLLTSPGTQPHLKEELLKVLAKDYRVSVIAAVQRLSLARHLRCEFYIDDHHPAETGPSGYMFKPFASRKNLMKR